MKNIIIRAEKGTHLEALLVGNAPKYEPYINIYHHDELIGTFSGKNLTPVERLPLATRSSCCQVISLKQEKLRHC